MDTSPHRIADPWGARNPYAPGTPWPARTDVHLHPGVAETDVERWVPAASLLHSNGDAMDIAVHQGRIVGVRGRAADRVNRGRLGPKDLYGWQANASPDRLTRPLVRDGGRLVECGWDTAMDRIVDRTEHLLEDRGPGAVGFYTTGQLFLEEYYTLAVLARAGIGTHHLDGNTRLCTATAAQALKETFGCDGQPGSYEDLDHADTVALFGHNMAETQTVLWMRLLDRLEGAEPPRLVCVDPRYTPVARRADVHLADTGHHYGLDLSGPRDAPSPGALAAFREKAAEALGRRPEAGLLLLHDLRELHLAAARNSLYWEMLAQAAQATRDDRLLALATTCHPQTLRQLRWTNTLIKELSPQLLTSV